MDKRTQGYEYRDRFRTMLYLRFLFCFPPYPCVSLLLSPSPPPLPSLPPSVTSPADTGTCQVPNPQRYPRQCAPKIPTVPQGLSMGINGTQIRWHDRDSAPSPEAPRPRTGPEHTCHLCRTCVLTKHIPVANLCTLCVSMCRSKMKPDASLFCYIFTATPNSRIYARDKIENYAHHCNLQPSRSPTRN